MIRPDRANTAKPDGSALPTTAFSLTDSPAVADLAAIWTDLESRADGGFFLSWAWLGPWLERISHKPRLFRAEQAGRILALGLLFEPANRGAGPAWRLQATGDAAQDSIYSEFNGLLADRAYPGLEQACWAWLGRELQAPLSLERLRPQSLEAALAALDGARTTEALPAPYVDLARIRAEDMDYLTSLSRNSRQQIRRSLKRFAQSGNLEITRAASLSQAHDFLDRLVSLHQKSWQARNRPGAFAREFFRSFHRDFVEMNLGEGLVDLLRISAGPREIGYLYNFRQGGSALSYQSGFAYSEDNREKPGLACHALAAQYYLDQGLAEYDFLCGEARYKQSLANAARTVTSLTTAKPGWKERLRAFL